jgi:tetratricopeptide (TPR) repeat protein
MARHVSGDLPGAEQKYQSAMDLIQNQATGEIEFTTEVNLMGNIAGVYGLTDRLDESLKIRQQVVAMSERLLPENHPDLIGAYDNLAVDYYFLEDLEQAKYWNKKSLDVFEYLTTNQQNQDDNFIYSYSMTLANYGVLLTRSKDYEQAKGVFTDVVTKLSQILGEQHTTVADYLYELANVHFQLGDNDLTMNFAERAIGIYEKDEVPFGSRELKSWLLKASVMNQSGQYDAVDDIETSLTSKLDSMDPKNQKLIDLAAEKFSLLKAARVLQ